jgi:hypothetical protein
VNNKGVAMATEIHKTWDEVVLQLSDIIDELQTWREYEEEVGYDLAHADNLTDAIEALIVVIAGSK